MRYIRYACIAVVAIALIAVALANRTIVELKVLPTELAGLFALNPSIELPLFLVIFGGVAAGLLIGFIWEWIREASIRSEAKKSDREKRRLEREVKRLKTEKHDTKDEVLALLDDAG
ncbi:MAG: LapA family protein [Pseudomonadota bacterium]